MVVEGEFIWCWQYFSRCFDVNSLLLQYEILEILEKLGETGDIYYPVLFYGYFLV